MIITLCGSTRFKDEFLEVQKELTLQGHIVLSVGLFGHADNIELTTEQKIKLDNLHKQKIDMSDGIFVVNVNGYIGESTFSEIDWAQRHNKTIWFLEEPPQEKEEAVDEQNVDTTADVASDSDN